MLQDFIIRAEARRFNVFIHSPNVSSRCGSAQYDNSKIGKRIGCTVIVTVHLEPGELVHVWQIGSIRNRIMSIADHHSIENAVWK